MEDLLKILIEIWEVRTCIPRYLHETHAHDPAGIGYHFPGIGQYIFEYFFWLKSGNSQDESFRDIFWSIG
jgi:hypothetical protein